jgi:hypothetical protein
MGMVDGQAWKKGHMGMAMVGYAEIGNMGCNVYRMVMWHLQGVEG